MDRKSVLSYFESSRDFFEHTVYPNIEKYRKGNMQIRVTDVAGKPIEGATVSVRQLSHEFKFGANLFMLDELETEEKNQIYKDSFKQIFNMATLPFYWNSLEEERGKPRYPKDSPKFYRRPAIDLCLEYCEENGIEPREHALAYERHFPRWLNDLSAKEAKNALEARYKEIAERYAHRIPTIEVTNEMCWDNGITALYNDPDYIEWCFKMADKYFPKNPLVINEYTEACWCDVLRPTNRYYAYIEAAILKGCRIDATGMQYHIFRRREGEAEGARQLYCPKNLYDHMDLYARLTKGLQVTEITVPAYSNESEDEEIQAELLKNLYTVWFSHPAMEQIVYWNLVDGYAYVENPTPEKIRASQGNMSLGENVYYGGLLRFDLTPKPAYRALDTLINEVWHTEACGQASGGIFDFRGFYGQYEVVIEANGKKETRIFNLTKNGENTLKIKLNA